MGVSFPSGRQAASSAGSTEGEHASVPSAKFRLSVKRPASTALPTIAAIDVGTNAVRLEIARVHPDGSLETLHQDRSPIRPGEGTFSSGAMSAEVVDRLLSTLRRYGALCRRFHARTRAVATSAVREAKNRQEIIRRVKAEAGLELEVVSGREEARLICMGVLNGRPPSSRSLVIDIGGGSTEVATAVGDRPTNLWSVPLGAVRVSELFEADGKVGKKKLALMREYAREVVAGSVPRAQVPRFKTALGSSGTINALVAWAAEEDTYPRVSARIISRAAEALAAMSFEEREPHFDSRRAEIIVGGAVVLEQAMEHLGLESITAVDRGLRTGLLFDLVRRLRSRPDDHSLGNAAFALSQRFGVEPNHARQVTRLALTLFDQLAPLHKLPASTRPLLEAAALLHNVGQAVAYQRHHKHSYYLIRHADLPGVADRERELIALTARYHRRAAPERSHPDVSDLSQAEFLIVRKLSTLLRLADALDRGHHQSVRRLKAGVVNGAVVLRLEGRGPLDLEVWDAEHDAALFRRVFGRRLELIASRARRGRRRR